MDDAGTEHEDGWVLVEDGLVAATGGGAQPEADERVDLGGAVVTPGLVNTHHHLYQTLTRARAQEADLFTWLKTLYPVWARLDEETEYAAARTGPRRARALRLHDRLRPPLRLPARRRRPDRGGGDAPRASSACGSSPRAARWTSASRTAGCRRTRSSRTPTTSSPTPSGWPRATRRQIVVAPCSPFSVTGELMRESAELARQLGLPLHTHLAETVEEEAYCRELYGCRPVEYLERLGWLDGDVWCAHCVHLSDDDIARFGATGTGVAHCPTSNLRLGAGVAPVRELLDAGVRVGLGVDGSASNERGDLFLEVKQALLVARGRGGPEALTAREALRLGTRGGASVLRRDDLGSLEPGKRADLAVWRTDGLELAGADDPVAGLVFAARTASTGSYVAGEEVVRDGPARARRRSRDRAGAPARGGEVLRMSVSLSTHVLDTERGEPGDRRARRALPRRASSWQPPRPTPTGAPAGRGARARPLPARLRAAVAVLPARRARARARGRPPPRAAARLVVRCASYRGS